MNPLFLLTALCLLPISGAHRIVGGQEARAHSRPYMVSLQSIGRHYCGGSLLYGQWVLTAAHCMENRHLDAIRVVVGAHDLQNPDGFQQVLNIQESIPHPNYNNKNYENDINLLKLSSPAIITDGVSTIWLAGNNTDVAPGTPCSVAGWGRLENGASPRALMETNVNVISRADCNQRWGGIIRYSMVCAAGPGQQINGFCRGDSGGPLVCGNRVEGVVSVSGRICGNPNTPDVYTRVSVFLDWIQQVINGR